MHCCWLLIAIIGSYGAFASEWSYTGVKGPNEWENLEGDEECGEKEESPINIPESLKYSFSAMIYAGYTNPPSGMTLTNNGHSAQVDLDLGDGNIGLHAWMGAGQLKGGYKAAQFHFHWGSSDDKGSEHAIQDKKYPLEMHIVHYSDRFKDLSEAANKEDGLAVLGVLFRVSNKDNHNLKYLTHSLKNIRYKGDKTDLKPFSLSTLLPHDKDHFYSYHGSLTTPPCYQTVQWRILRETVSISEKQLNAFRSLYSEEEGHGDDKLVDNFRPVQPLNGRTVYKNWRH